MRPLFTCFLAILLIGNTLSAQAPQKDYSQAFQLIEVWLEAQKDYEQLPALTATVVEDQAVLWSGGFGKANLENHAEAEASTLFSICSISKLFTAVAIMKLYDEGKLRLDDRVDDLLPHYNLAQKYPESGPITVRALLTHSSGLPREAAYPYWTGPDFPFPTQAQVDGALGKQETLYPASTYFQYSNLGLTLLGEIVTEVSGQPYEEFVRQHILEPLDLADTRTELPQDLYGDQLAIGYTPLNRTGNREKVNFFQANGITAAAGYSSNVLDLGKFASWQFRLRDSTVTEILKPSTLKFMQQVHWTNPDWKNTWGLGFSVYKGRGGRTWVGHGGSCPGYRSSLQLDLKNKRAYSVMINAGGSNPGKYIQGICEILDKVKAENTQKDAGPTADLQEYTGYYSLTPWWSEAYLMPWGKDQLVTLSLPSDSPKSAMTFYKHVEGDTFRRMRDDGELGETLVFGRDEGGQVVQFTRHNNITLKIDRSAPN